MEDTLRYWTKGKPVTHWLCRLPPNHYQYAAPSLRKVKLNSGTLELDLSDFLEWHFFFDFADESISNLLALARPGDTVLDIGSNIGATVLALSRHVGQGGQVWGFEPDPDRYEKSRRLLAANGFFQPLVFPLALGDIPGKGKIRVRDKFNKGMNQICPFDTTARTPEITIVRLDDFVREKGISKMDLIKIDVEGYEAKVLDGALKTISQFRPKLFIEVFDCNLKDHGNRPNDLFMILRRLGYTLYKNTVAHPMALDDETSSHFDLVAIP